MISYGAMPSKIPDIEYAQVKQGLGDKTATSTAFVIPPGIALFTDLAILALGAYTFFSAQTRIGKAMGITAGIFGGLMLIYKAQLMLSPIEVAYTEETPANTL